MLITQLYPWLSVRETSTNEVAEELTPEENPSKTETKESKPEETVKQKDPVPEKSHSGNGCLGGRGNMQEKFSV